jgi:hypothetical protein
MNYAPLSESAIAIEVFLGSHPHAFPRLLVGGQLFVLFSYTLLEAHLRLRKRQELNRRTRTSIFPLLIPTLQVVAVYYRQRFCLFSVPEFARILLTLDDPARSQLLEKIHRIGKNLYSLLENARPP